MLFSQCTVSVYFTFSCIEFHIVISLWCTRDTDEWTNVLTKFMSSFAIMSHYLSSLLLLIPCVIYLPYKFFLCFRVILLCFCVCIAFRNIVVLRCNFVFPHLCGLGSLQTSNIVLQSFAEKYCLIVFCSAKMLYSYKVLQNQKPLN